MGLRDFLRVFSVFLFFSSSISNKASYEMMLPVILVALTQACTAATQPSETSVNAPRLPTPGLIAFRHTYTEFRDEYASLYGIKNVDLSYLFPTYKAALELITKTPKLLKMYDDYKSGKFQLCTCSSKCKPKVLVQQVDSLYETSVEFVAKLNDPLNKRPELD